MKRCTTPTRIKIFNMTRLEMEMYEGNILVLEMCSTVTRTKILRNKYAFHRHVINTWRSLTKKKGFFSRSSSLDEKKVASWSSPPCSWTNIFSNSIPAWPSAGCTDVAWGEKKIRGERFHFYEIRNCGSPFFLQNGQEIDLSSKTNTCRLHFVSDFHHSHFRKAQGRTLRGT